MPVKHQLKDVIIFLPGITGSVLRKDNADVWAASPGALLGALKSNLDNLRSIALDHDDPDAPDLGDGVSVGGMIEEVHLIPGFWKIDGYTHMRERLLGAFDATAGKNYFDFPYDWRRDNRAAARRLKNSAEKWLEDWKQGSGSQDAKLVLVAHSMGGLIARHYLELLDGWRHTRTLITFGTPYQGGPKPLGFVVNGYHLGFGPISFDFSAVMRSFTSTYQLLPNSEILERRSGDGYEHVADAMDLPNVDHARAVEARAFHDAINAAARARKASGDTEHLVHPIVGLDQPTAQSVRRSAGGVTLLMEYEGQNAGGDGTVPQVSATPAEDADAGREMYAFTTHGSLQHEDGILDDVVGIIARATVKQPRVRAEKVSLALELADAYLPGLIPMRVRPSNGERANLTAVVENLVTHKRTKFSVAAGDQDGWHDAQIGTLRDGVYRVTVTGQTLSQIAATPVSDVFAVVG